MPRTPNQAKSKNNINLHPNYLKNDLPYKCGNPNEKF